MQYTSREIKEGIKIHFTKTEKFKTNVVSMFLTVPLDKKTVTANALIASVLRLGTNKLNNQEEINKTLEEMYGAEFNCGIDKIGTNQIIKFYIEILNDKFLPIKENILEKAINLILDIAFDPIVENDGFLEQYVNTEKANLKNIIESKINDKDQYAYERCIEEMYKNDAFSIYKYGYVDDIKDLNPQNLYNQYKQVIDLAKIDIYVSGDFKQKEVEDFIEKNEHISGLAPRNVENIVIKEVSKNISENAKTIEEKMNITQGKLVLGLDVDENSDDSRYSLITFNVMFGASPTSKLFQNVREKASLAYTASSSYIRQKNNFFVRCGIEIRNYDKAVKIILEQLDKMKNGDFSEEELNSAKIEVKSAIRGIQEDQSAEIGYYIGQELSGKKPNFDEYMKKIDEITREQIIDISNKITVNTIYFLTGGKDANN